MSWYANPKLFLRCKGSNRRFHIYRIEKKYNAPLFNGDFRISSPVDFSRHLSLGYNQESDYDILKYWLDEAGGDTRYVNCQGMVIYWDRCNDCPGTWSRVEEDDPIFYSLPGIVNPSEVKLAEKLKAVRKYSELVAEISSLKDKLNNEVRHLQEQLNQEKNDRLAQVSDLTAKLKECRGAGGGMY